jgi:EpsI family protein
MSGLGSLLKRKAIPVAMAILVAQTFFYYRGSAKESTPSIKPWSQFPSAVGGWNETGEMALDPEVLTALQPDDYLVRGYQTGGGVPPVSLFIGYFNSRRDGRAPHSPQWCLPGAGWDSVWSKVVAIPLAGAGTFPANEYLIRKGLDEELVYYWYHQGGRTVANEVVAQIYSIPDLIFHGRTDVALVRIIVPVARNDLSQARATGMSFAQVAYPLIRQHIK